MCKEREYKRLDTVSNAFSVPVPGTKEFCRSLDDNCKTLLLCVNMPLSFEIDKKNGVPL